MWIKPEDLALSVFKSLNDIERKRVRANIDNYGTAFFRSFITTKYTIRLCV